MLTQKEIKSFIKNRKTVSHGNVKVFIPISNNIAIKICENIENRDNNYFYQELAADHDIGPDVYGTFEIKVNQRTLYGYYTEIVKTFDTYSEFSQKFSENDIESLENKLESLINYYSADIFYANVGEKDGQLVCIDFDTKECYGYHSDKIISLIQNL